MEPARPDVVCLGMRRFFAFAVLTGCHPPSVPGPVAEPVPRSVPPVSEPDLNDVWLKPPPKAPDPCEGLDRVVVTAPDFELRCKDGHRRCEGTTTFSLRNCTGSSVEFVEMQIREGEGVLVFTPAESTLAPGASWTKESTFFREGDHSVVATLREGEALVDTDPVQLRIENPARDTALLQCEACNGTWGVYGISSTEGCNCSTTDGGKVCRDGDDCEASCMFDRFEVVRVGSRTCAADGSCAVEPELARPVGRCNGTVMSFGCKARIKAGASKDPAVTLPSRAPVQCVD